MNASLRDADCQVFLIRGRNSLQEYARKTMPISIGPLMNKSGESEKKKKTEEKMEHPASSGGPTDHQSAYCVNRVFND